MIRRWLLNSASDALDGWNRFWFGTEYGPQMTLFRVGFASLIFFFEITRIADLDLFYSESGLVPLSVFHEFMEVPYKLTLLTFVSGHAGLWACHILELLSLLTLALGFFPRLSAVFALAMHVSFMHRNMGINYGVDNISTFFMFYLCFADYRTKPARDLRSMLGSAAMRLVQIQICIVYVYAGLDKIRGASWWSGDALWFALGNTQRCPWDFGFLAHFPVVIAFLTYSTLIFETYFPLLVVSRQTRAVALWSGLFLHLGIAISMNLFVFSILMVMTYLTFLDPELCQAVIMRVRNHGAKVKVLNETAEENYV